MGSLGKDASSSAAAAEGGSRVVMAVNGVRREAAGVHPSMTLLEFLRTKTPVRGPKLGCGEVSGAMVIPWEKKGVLEHAATVSTRLRRKVEHTRSALPSELSSSPCTTHQFTLCSAAVHSGVSLGGPDISSSEGQIVKSRELQIGN